MHVVGRGGGNRRPKTSGRVSQCMKAALMKEETREKLKSRENRSPDLRGDSDRCSTVHITSASGGRVPR